MTSLTKKSLSLLILTMATPAMIPTLMRSWTGKVIVYNHGKKNMRNYMKNRNFASSDLESRGSWWQGFVQRLLG